MAGHPGRQGDFSRQGAERHGDDHAAVVLHPPWVATKNSGLKPLEPAPYYLRPVTKADAGEESLNTRGERVFQVLGEDKKFTLEDMIDLGFDTYNLAADVVVPLLTRAYDANP